MSRRLDLPGSPASTRVAVAMSGGVDSSVVAALLKRDGYDVVGVTLQLYSQGGTGRRSGACCAGSDIADARRVADRIGIPHYVLDYEERFRQAVVEPFAQSYAAGETPIPCVECNRSLKFRDLLGAARSFGAQCLATGHYVASRAGLDGRRKLLRAADRDRDQSYFLYATTREQLDFLRFPLGDCTKSDTRRLAAEFGLSVAAKPDSQDICFVPHGRYDALVERLRPDAARPGDIVHVDGRVLGRHAGVFRFTVGQRRGIGVSAPDPLYVVRLDAVNARVVVGPSWALLAGRLHLRDLNWIGPAEADQIGPEGLSVAVKTRSTRPPVPARLHMGHAGPEVELLVPADAVAPGQACVIYADRAERAEVWGGGTIDRVVQSASAAVAA